MKGANPGGGKRDFVYDSGTNGRQDIGIKRDPMLGINLEGSGVSILRDDGCGDQLREHLNMEHDGEEIHVENIDGKKRLRNDMGDYVTTGMENLVLVRGE